MDFPRAFGNEDAQAGDEEKQTGVQGGMDTAGRFRVSSRSHALTVVKEDAGVGPFTQCKARLSIVRGAWRE